jgi:Ankyrin repeats (3 copies)
MQVLLKLREIIRGTWTEASMAANEHIDQRNNQASIYEMELEEANHSTLFSVCEFGLVNTVKLLLTRGVDVNVRVSGESPLHCACRNGHIQIALELVKHGADVYSLNPERHTPLEELEAFCVFRGFCDTAIKDILQKLRTEANWVRRRDLIMFLAGYRLLLQQQSGSKGIGESINESSDPTGTSQQIALRVLGNRDLSSAILSFL